MQALLRPNTNSTHKWNGTLQHYKDASEIPNISKQPVLLSNAHQTHPTPYVPTRQGQRRQCMHGVLRPPASIGRFDGRVFESWVPSKDAGVRGESRRVVFNRMVAMGWHILLAFIIVIIGVGDRASRCGARPCIPGRLLGHLQQ